MDTWEAMLQGGKQGTLFRPGDILRQPPRSATAAALGPRGAHAAKEQLRPLTPDGPWLAASARLQTKQFGDAQLAQLAELAAVGPVLQWLDLGETGVTDAGMVHLASMRELRRLQLDRTAVTDSGLPALAPLMKLESLNLFGTDVTDTGVGALRVLPRLRRLHLWQTQVTPEAASKLAKEATDERRIRRWQEEIAARERMIRAERFSVTTGETFPEVRVVYPPAVERETAAATVPGAP